MIPYQNIFLGPWIAFPVAPNLIPVNFDKGLNAIIDQASELYLLIETETMPNLNCGDDILMVCTVKCCLLSCLVKCLFYFSDGKLWDTDCMES